MLSVNRVVTFWTALLRRCLNNEDATMVAIRERYPFYYQQVLLETAMVVMYKNRHRVAHQMLMTRLDHVHAEQQLLVARAPTTPAARSCGWVGMFVAMICLVAYMLGGYVVLSQVSGVRAVGRPNAVTAEAWIVVFLFLLWIGLRMYAVSKSQAKVFRSWLDARTEEPGSERGRTESGIERLSEEDVVPPVEAGALPEAVERGTMDIWVDGQPMDLEQAFSVLSCQTGGSNVLYPMIITQALMYAPAKTEVNLLFACAARLHLPVTGEQDESIVAARWEEATLHMVDIIPEGVVQPLTREQCASFLSTQKAKVYMECAADLEAGRLRPVRGFPFRKEVNVKTNETIAAKEFRGEPSIKPRAIVVLGNDYHVVHSVHARAVANRMHELFDGKWFTFSGCTVRIWFASGLTGAQLNEIGRAIQAGDNVIAVAGDDSLCRNNAFDEPKHPCFGRGAVFEGDLKACDQSQRHACLQNTCRIFLRLGVPQVVVAEFYAMCCAPYTARYKRVRVVGNPGPELPTGADETTIGNSLAVLSMLVMSFVHRATPEKIAYEMGFTLKVQYGNDVCERTLLKGTFLPDSNGELCYYPLPSLLLKVGKMQTDPKRLADSRSEGIRVAARAMAQGMPTVPRNYPLLGPFLSALERSGQKTRKVLSAAEDSWYKPSVSAAGVDHVSALEFVCRRYSITIDDVNRCEALLNQINHVPMFVFDPVFDRLATVDYE